MAVSVKQATKAFELLYAGLLSKKFSKTLKFKDWGEQNLLPLVRVFLLGYFGESIVPEAKSRLPGSLSGYGKIDFMIDQLAVEFIVRKPNAKKISQTDTDPEVKKLMKYDGLSLLVIYDFSRSPMSLEKIDELREIPSLGRGPHKKSAFNVAYYYIKSKKPIEGAVMTKRILP